MAEKAKIIVVGSGPVGLTTALSLAHQGVPVAVCEKEPWLTEDLRAGSYHPPTLEMLAPFGITKMMHEEGIVVPTWQIRDRKHGLIGEFDLSLLKDETPYPYRLHLEQHKLTPLLLRELIRFPDAEVHFSSRVLSATQDQDGVVVKVQTADGIEEVRGSFLVGADGHYSVVREAMGTAFPGYTHPELFLIVSITQDMQPQGFAFATYIADPDEWVMLFKVPGFNPPALWRLAFPADPDRPREETMDLDTVQKRLQGFVPRREEYEVIHRNAYRVHQRVAATFNAGRMAIAGDAAHVNNPLGGMGLNGGVHDAINLAEKLGRLWRGEARGDSLDLYTRQRRPTQIKYVQSITERNKRLVEERDPRVRLERLEEIRRIADDRERSFAFLMDTSMINSVREAAAIG